MSVVLAVVVLALTFYVLGIAVKVFGKVFGWLVRIVWMFLIGYFLVWAMANGYGLPVK